jgi:hypothetical protein
MLDTAAGAERSPVRTTSAARYLQKLRILRLRDEPQTSAKCPCHRFARDVAESFTGIIYDEWKFNPCPVRHLTVRQRHAYKSIDGIGAPVDD